MLGTAVNALKSSSPTTKFHHRFFSLGKNLGKSIPTAASINIPQHQNTSKTAHFKSPNPVTKIKT
jgi:hypothetical protein